MEERDLFGRNISVTGADYGSTDINIGTGSTADMITISGISYDYGRAEATGRQESCELFAQLLGDEIAVRNSDPNPRDKDMIIL